MPEPRKQIRRKGVLGAPPSPAGTALGVPSVNGGQCLQGREPRARATSKHPPAGNKGLGVLPQQAETVAGWVGGSNTSGGPLHSPGSVRAGPPPTGHLSRDEPLRAALDTWETQGDLQTAPSAPMAAAGKQQEHRAPVGQAARLQHTHK